MIGVRAVVVIEAPAILIAEAKIFMPPGLPRRPAFIAVPILFGLSGWHTAVAVAVLLGLSRRNVPVAGGTMILSWRTLGYYRTRAGKEHRMHEQTSEQRH
jgi:hypothetical protein